ncbi:MAG TPA: pyridoxamine 5'-phosphate oxidase [Micromonosporaceae bacterium]|nr:pyridoxamine 5'-phosphate oxidase [Micromonosporaceae bacterium]
MRQPYSAAGLEPGDLDPDPLRQFAVWFAEAEAAGLAEPNAMVLATTSADGWPNARLVLLKGLDRDGFVFFTNLVSAKGCELRDNPRAALVLPWHGMSRQVRVQGWVHPVDRAEVTAYFEVRPRGSQLSAWASDQSRVLASREEVERRYREMDERFAGRPVTPPAHWGGLRVLPYAVEFWQGRADRLHDRLRYRRAADGRWRVERLAP